MPSPGVLSRPWYTRGNATLGDTSTAALINKSWIWQLKAHLLDQVSSGTEDVARPVGSVWTVVGSSDSSTANMTGTDLWDTSFNSSKIVQAAAATPHSWIVLQSPAAMGPVYLCIDCNSATTANASLVFSRSAFSGGTISARPTASNEWQPGTTSPGTAVPFMNDTTTGVIYRSNFVVDDSGQWIYATARSGTGIFNTLSFCLNALDTRVGDNAPTWSGLNFNSVGRGAGIFTTTGLGSNTAIQGRTASNGAVNNIGGAVNWSFGTTAFASAATADVLSGDWNALPVWLYSMVLSNHAWRGYLPDMWVMGIPTVGASYPNSVTPTHHVVGDLLVPMGVVPVL